MKKLTRTSDPPAERTKAARKAATYLNQFVFFAISAYWGWVALCDTQWLPWYLGGLKDGSPELAMKDFPFIPQRGAGGCNCYILFTYGYHINELIDNFLYNKKEKNY